MVLIYTTSNKCIELEQATDVETTSSELICLKSRGQEVARYHLWDVLAYTSDSAYLENFREEACKEQDGRTGVSGARTNGDGDRH